MVCSSEALAPGQRTLAGPPDGLELHPPIPGYDARRTISWCRWLRNCSARKPTW